MEAMMSELDIFSRPVNNLCVEKSHVSTYLPLSSLDGDGPISFSVIGSSEHYIDLSQTLLQVKVKVLTGQSATLTTEVVAPANNFLHSLFSQVEVQVQDKVVGDTSNFYPYKSYLETLLNYGRDAKESQMGTQLFYKESNTNPTNLFATVGSGLKNRQVKIAGSKSVEMIGKLNYDLFHSDRYLLNNVSFKISLTRAKPGFCLLSDAVGDYKIVFESAILHIKKVKVSTGIQLAHAKVMEEGGTAKYPFSATGIKTFHAAAGLTDISQDNVFLGTLPAKLLICLVSTTAKDGAITANPFEFKHYDLNHLAVVTDSDMFPSKPFTPNFNLDQYGREYISLFSVLNTFHRNEGNWLTYDEFKTGNTIYAVDLSADLNRSSSALEPSKQGNLRIEMRFARPLPENVTCIIYYEHSHNVMEIDKNRNILLDTTI